MELIISQFKIVYGYCIYSPGLGSIPQKAGIVNRDSSGIEPPLSGTMIDNFLRMFHVLSTLAVTQKINISNVEIQDDDWQFF